MRIFFITLCIHLIDFVLPPPMTMARVLNLFLLRVVLALENHQLTPHLKAPLCHDLLLQPSRHLLHREQYHVIW